MDNLNLPPFFNGQQIVRTGPSNPYVKKGQTYTADICIRCPKCKNWLVSIVGALNVNRWPLRCCETVLGSTPKHMGGYAKLFAPVQESFQSISYEKVIENELIGVN